MPEATPLYFPSMRRAALLVLLASAALAAQPAPTTSFSATDASSTAPAARGIAPTSAVTRGHHRLASRRRSRRRRRATIDVSGLVVAPGFIDIHTHARRGIFEVPTADNYVRQGVTTLIEGPDGSSPLPLAPFLESWRRRASRRTSRASSGRDRFAAQVIGEVNRPATPTSSRRCAAGAAGRWRTAPSA